jgi:hypothetical protein
LNFQSIVVFRSAKERLHTLHSLSGRLLIAFSKWPLKQCVDNEVVKLNLREANTVKQPTRAENVELDNFAAN